MDGYISVLTFLHLQIKKALETKKKILRKRAASDLKSKTKKVRTFYFLFKSCIACFLLINKLDNDPYILPTLAHKDAFFLKCFIIVFERKKEKQSTLSFLLKLY